MDQNDGKHKTGRSKGPPVPRKKKKLDAVNVETKQQQESVGSDSICHVPQEQLVACENLLRLPILYDDIVLECVCARYVEGLYYTWAGPTLVATNPCHPVDHLYTPAQIEHLHNLVKTGAEGRVPHVYSVASVAHHHLLHDLGLVNQAVLVSGESGSGKTESARYMLGYLTYIEKHFSQAPKLPLKALSNDKQPQDIQEKILASNPILEAFGNASTLRNHNSSRFGKLVRLQYGGGRLRGAEIDTYLLEKTRVTHQPDKERNFHIFYQVVSGVKAGMLEDLVIEKEQNFAILSRETTATDCTNLQETLHAFRQLQFSASHLKEIYQVILALLHLGNIQFKEEERGNTSWTVDIDHEESLKGLRTTCRLLGLSEDQLVKTLTVHTLYVSSGGKVNVFHKPLERENQCAERRDALMQLLYQSLFLHIVTFINSKISTHRNMWSNFMGILDIYGFETFEQNSLEQLCINYANERLQQAFILRYLATEHEILKEEGFLEMDVPYTDNSNCVSVLDSHISVFTILNEECQLKRDVKEDEACSRICNALENTGLVCALPYHRSPTSGFVVRHYAGPVKYEARGLLHKNKDEVPHEVLELLASSSSNFVNRFTLDNTDLETGRRTTRKITTLSKFKSSLDSMMKTLSSCDLHYVRCIKPNVKGFTGRLDREYLLQQLRACGVIETVQISQAGYPVRISYEDFFMRYGGRHKTTDVAAACTEVAKSVLTSTPEEEVNPLLCRFGRTRVFLSETALRILEEVREGIRIQAATCLQKYWRRQKCWRQFNTLRRASLVVQRNIRVWLAKNRYKKLKCACILIQAHVRKMFVRQQYLRLHKAVVTIQRYFRGWTARRRFEVTMRHTAMRPYSRQSLMSMHSSGYGSMANSSSLYSLNPSVFDISPFGAPSSDVGAFSLSEEMLSAYVSPQHHQRLLETEESGIETDTESINGATDSLKRKKRRRREQLQKLLQSKTKVHHTASDESLVDKADRSDRLSEPKEEVACKNEAGYKDSKDLGEEILDHHKSTKKGRNSSDENMRKEKPVFHDAPQKMRIATLRNLQEISSVLKGYTSPEDLQVVLSEYSISLFFKSGVLSYRRMPMVSIKFHTRPTCLPFSHHLPHREHPQGLWEVLP